MLAWLIGFVVGGTVVGGAIALIVAFAKADISKVEEENDVSESDST